MRALLLLSLVLLPLVPATPAAAAPTYSFDVSSLACTVQGQVASPSAMYRCTVAASVAIVVGACDATSCRFDTFGNAIFTSVLPAFGRVATRIADAGAGAWTCYDQSETLGTGAGCSGATQAHAVQVAAGQCRSLALEATGTAALAPLDAAPGLLGVQASRTINFCREAAGHVLVSG